MVHKMYSDFDFYKLQISLNEEPKEFHNKNNENSSIENFIIRFLKNDKFIIFDVLNIQNSKNIADSVFCVENNCAIIEHISIKSM